MFGPVELTASGSEKFAIRLARLGGGRWVTVAGWLALALLLLWVVWP